MDTSSWSGYLNANSTYGIPAHSDATAKYPTTSDAKGKVGFTDLTPQRPDLQSRYDAMSGSWEGVAPASKAVIDGLFKSGPSDVDKTLPQRK
jgi:hypothetical protein